MELFNINRYMGEEEKNEENTPNEAKLRKKLLKKIKERKRLSESLLNEDNTAHIKKKKKENLEEVEINISENSSNNFAHPEKGVISKKKKSKSKIYLNEHVNENEIGNEESLSNALENDQMEVEENGKPETENNDENAFTILQDALMYKKVKVKRKLPDWLANPSVVSVDLKNLKSTVDSIPELDKIFIDKLKENNITHFFPVQEQVIPWLLQIGKRPYRYWPNDICVSAPTGSGKTLAFVLPILQTLNKRIVPRIRALVVLPVQDLATQVYKVFETYSKPTNLNILLLTKKRIFEEEQNLIRKIDGLGNYRNQVDIIVTTPGRLVDHLTRTNGFSLSDLVYLVIDEADRIMDNIQNDWLYQLNKHISSECNAMYQTPIVTYNNLVNKKRPPHKLLFSATLSQDPEKLQQLNLFQPKLFTSIVKSEKSVVDEDDKTKFIGKYTTPAELQEFFATCSKSHKPLIIHHLIESNNWKNILCFVNSSKAIFKLAFVLKKLSKKNIKIGVLSSILTVKQRNLVLDKFSRGDMDLLISSDALARGIDIPHVQYVISYDFPKFVKTYIHRIGRTGRAGKEGTSLILLTSKEVNNFQKMITSVGKKAVNEMKLEEEELIQYEDNYKEALEKLGNLLEKKKEKILKKIKAKRRQQVLAEKGKFVKIKKKKKVKPNKSS